jgi:hypothetical protein
MTNPLREAVVSYITEASHEAYTLSKAGAVARLYKAAASPVTAGQVAEHLVGVARKLPKGVFSTFKDVGERVTKGMAMDPNAPGTLSRLAGGAVRYTPHALATYGAYKLTSPSIGAYIRSKIDQHRALQEASMPYYDPTTQRYM